MSDTLSNVLTDAYAALQPIGPPVLLAGDPDPDGEQVEVIILTPVSDTNRPTYGLQVSEKRVQVTAYAATLTRALALTDQARAALRSVGLRYIASRPAPDPDYVGMLSEYRR